MFGKLQKKTFFGFILFSLICSEIFCQTINPVTNLRISKIHFKQVTLQWTAPLAPNNIVKYQIRLSTYRVLSTETDWENNSSSTDYPYRIFIDTNSLSGQSETYTITGLKNGQVYFFAIKASTDAVTWSEIDISSPRPYAVPVNNTPEQFSPIWPVSYVVVTSQTVIPFDWDDVYDKDLQYGDIVKYELYYSTVESTLSSTPPTFSGGYVGFVGNITTSYVEVPSNFFVDNTTYYWRVKAIDSEGEISWSYYPLVNRESRFVVNNIYQPPSSVVLLTPCFSTTTTPVFFDWSDATDQDPQDIVKYSLYISSQGQNYGFVNAVSNITWSSFTLASVFNGWVENTTYWWYVVAVDNFGLKSFSATSWFIINNNEEPPTQNLLLSPGTTIYHQFDINTTNHVLFTLHPTFYWTSSFDPDPSSNVYYQLFISSYSDKPDELNSVFYTTQRVYSTFYYLTELVLQDRTTYFWHVRIWDEPYSQYAVFSSTVFWFYTCVNNQNPSAATLILPQNESTTSYFYPTFVWEVGQDFGFNGSVSSQTLIYWTNNDTTTVSLSATTTFYIPAVPLKNNSTYFWQIITYDNGYPPPQLSSASVVYKFFIRNSLPKSFNLLSPSSGSIIETQNVQLFWEQADEPDSEPVFYKVVWSTDNFKTFFSSSGLTSTNFILSNLVDNTTYFWYVTAYDIWDLSTFSLTTFYFVVDNFPQNPLNFDLYLPPNNAVLYNTFVTFSWQQTVDPDPYEKVSYVLKISTTQEFQQPVFSTQTFLTSFYLPQGILKVNTTYYWTVEAVSLRSGVTTANFSPYKFYIFNTPPTRPRLVSPENKQIVYTSSITLSWETPIDYQSHEFYYELYISSDNQQTWTKIVLPKEQEEYNIENLVDDTTYWWYIVAIDTYQAKSFSDVYKFFTSYQNLPPSTPTILTPQDNEVIYLPYTIKWTTSTDNDIFDYVSYKIEISTDKDFSKILQEYFTNNTFIELKDFTIPYGTYYLRILAYDSQNLQTVSPTVKFFIPVYLPTIFSPQDNEVITKLPIKFSFLEIKPIVSFDTITYKIIFSSYTDFRIKTEIVLTTTEYFFSKEGVLNPASYYLCLEVNDSFGHLAKSKIQNFVIPDIFPPAPKNIVVSTEAIEWEDIDIPNFWHYRIYFGGDFNNLYLISISTTSFLKLEKLYDGFYTVKTVNQFGVESKDNIFVRIVQDEQADYYFSEDKFLLVSIPKSEGIVVEIKKLVSEQPNIVLAYDIISEKQKTEKFCRLEFIKPQEDKNYYIEYFDGHNWVSIPFSQDKNKMYITTQYLGKYRVVELVEPKSDQISILGCSPKKKIITPNNDGKNDYIEFHYNSVIEGYVYDLNLGKVCKLKHRSPTVLYFDGKDDDGRLLPAGIYIYQINAVNKNKMFKGTIVIKY
jgi:hypothetical protein